MGNYLDLVNDLKTVGQNIKQIIDDGERINKFVKTATIEELITYYLTTNERSYICEENLSSRNSFIRTKIEKYLRYEATKEDLIKYLYILKDHFADDLESGYGVYIDDVYSDGYLLTYAILKKAIILGALVSKDWNDKKFYIYGTDYLITVIEDEEDLSYMPFIR